MTLAHWIPNPGYRTLGENRESLRCRFWRYGPVCCWPGRSSVPPSGWKARAVPNHRFRLHARGARGHDRTSKRRRSSQTESLPGSEHRRFYINIRSWNAPQPRKSLAPHSKQRASGPNPAWDANSATERSSLLPKSLVYSPCQQAGQSEYHQPTWTAWR